MDLKSGMPYWLLKNGLPKEYPALSANLDTEVLVLGGGISGALCAYHFAKAGIGTVLIDKRSAGMGSTAASTSLLQYQIDVSYTELSEKIGASDATLAYRQCKESIDYLQNVAQEIGFWGLNRRPTLFFASDRDGVKLIEREYAAHKAMGFDVQKLEKAEIKERFGFGSALALQSQHSAETDAYAFSQALLEAAQGLGAKVFQRSEITRIKEGKAEVSAGTSDGVKVKCRHLVHATGYEVDEKLYRNIVKLQSTFAYVTEPINPELLWWKRSLIWETKEPYLYIRTTADNRILVGGGDENHNNPEKRQRQLPGKVKSIHKKFLKLFPQLKAAPEYCWAGTFGSTKDGLPYIGSIEGRPRQLYALGFGGNGITFSAIAAKQLTAHLLGKPEEGAHLYRFGR